VFIPVSIRADETVKAKKADIIDMHTGNIKSTNETRDGIDYQKLYNIHIDKVASFLTSEEYTQFSQA
jgi:NMD protein affecting ribosome stability and mRNA decay